MVNLCLREELPGKSVNKYPLSLSPFHAGPYAQCLVRSPIAQATHMAVGPGEKVAFPSPKLASKIFASASLLACRDPLGLLPIKYQIIATLDLPTIKKIWPYNTCKSATTPVQVPLLHPHYEATTPVGCLHLYYLWTKRTLVTLIRLQPLVPQI